MKRLFTIMMLFFACSMFAQDSIKKKDSLNVYTELTLATRNVWRGASYGNSPSMQGTLSFSYKNLEVGSFAAITLNGSAFGYGNWLENYVTYKAGKLSFTIDDYFFMSGVDSLNNYFEYAPTRTQHLVEGRIKYTDDNLALTVAYNSLYKNKADTTSSFYLEAEYFVKPNFSFIAGYITGASSLSFYDKAGFTTLGVTGKKSITVSGFKMPIKAALLFNPNYKNISKYTNLGANPVNLVVSITF